MVAGPGRLSIIVPVWNEADILPQTVPSVLNALKGLEARLIYVCNGCTDDSAARLHALLSGRGEVIDLPASGKTLALNAGDLAAGDCYPRFYLDADVRPAEDAFRILAAALADGSAELVAPVVRFDLARASLAARWVADVWTRLPHGRGAAFHHLLGVSQLGRSRWTTFPAVTGDDIFIEATIPKERRRIVTGTHVVTWPPASFSGWIATRRRWMRGERELAARSMSVPRAVGQRKEIVRLLLRPGWTLKVMVFLAVRFIALVPDRGAWSRNR